MDEKTLARPDLEWQKLKHLIPDHLFRADWQDVQLAFLPEVSKSLGARGIRHFTLDYWNDRDPRLANLYQNRFRARLRIKVNRNDTSHIYLFDPDSGQWIPVPRADGDLTPKPEWVLKEERKARRELARTPWSIRAKDREQLDEIAQRARGKSKQGSSKKLTRRDASDRLAAEIAVEAPQPAEDAIELNRLKTQGNGFGKLPATDEIYEAIEWRDR